LLDEHFENGIPGSWTIINADTFTLWPTAIAKGFTGQFQPYNHLGRNCVTNCSRFTNVANSANDYLVTPAITLGSGPICLSWKASAQHPAFTDGYEVRISLTGPTVAGLQANAPLFTINAELDPWTEHWVDLSAYAGNTVNIGFWHNTAGLDLCLDDICISQPVSRDAGVTSVLLSDVVAPGAKVISGKLLNSGTAPITSLDVSWNVNNGPANTMNVPSMYTNPGSYYSFMHSVNWIPPANGTYYLKVWTGNINGMGDQYSGNDTLTRVIFVNTFPRKVLIEDFTQASCIPCAGVNPHLDSLTYINLHNNKVASIHYEVEWPGYDPMYLFNPTYIMERVDYYGIVTVPYAMLDGTPVPNDCNVISGYPGCLEQPDIDSASAIPSIFDIQVNNFPNGNTMNVNVQVTAKTDVPQSTFRLFTAVVEDTIIYSTAPGTNGETTFHQVMRTLLPDSSGQLLPPMLNNQVLNFNYSYPIDPIYQVNELRSVSFISDDATRRVYQSYTTVNYSFNGVNELAAGFSVKVYPNPAGDLVGIYGEGLGQAAATYSLKNVLGETWTSGAWMPHGGKLNELVDVRALSPGIYFVEIRNDLESVVIRFIKN
jgi:hypothetical protein